MTRSLAERIYSVYNQYTELHRCSPDTILVPEDEYETLPDNAKVRFSGCEVHQYQGNVIMVGRLCKEIL